MSERLERVLEKLPAQKRRKTGNHYKVLCPAHNDKNPSLKVEAGEKAILLYCFAGCETEEVMKAAGLKWSDLGGKRKKADRSARQQTDYPLYDAEGTFIGTHHRLDLGDGDKRFWWTDADGNKSLPLPVQQLPLYGAQKLAHAPASTYIVVTEGEKDTEALQGKLGPLEILAVVTGTKTEPSDESLAVLRGRRVILWPDNDAVGRSMMRRIAEKLYGVAESIQMYRWSDAPPGGGGDDWPLVDEAASDALVMDLITAPDYKPRKTRIEGAVGVAAYSRDFMGLVDARIEHDGITGIRTGITKMDKGLGGLNEDTLTVIAAGTNHGKSLMVGEIGLEAARQDKNILIVSTEQWPVIYIDRWAHVIADVSYEKGKSGMLSKAERKDLEEAVYYLSGLPLMISYGNHTVSQIRDLADKHETELLIVDYVQLVEPDDRSMNRSQQVAQVSHDIATLKGDLGIAVVNAAQLNRNPLSRKGENKKPNMGDIHWSYEVVQDADHVVLMQNPHRDGVEKAEKGIIRLFCDKNRFGYPWWTEVRYRGDLPWLEDIPTPYNKGGQERLIA